jgi:hypothetical protein
MNQIEEAKAIKAYMCESCKKDFRTNCYNESKDSITCRAYENRRSIPIIPREFCGIIKPFRFNVQVYSSWNVCRIIPNKKYLFSVKHLSYKGHTIFKVFDMKKSEHIVLVILEDCLDKVNCIHLS